MKKTLINLQKCMAVALLFLLTACSKNENDLANQSELESFAVSKTLTTTQMLTINNGDTILNATFENGTTISGITGLNPTNATASDAAYVVSPGGEGTYAVAHKATLGLPGYYSDAAYRSEADADNVANARFLPGDERRYEFSLLLKDWEQWTSPNPAYGNNIFQLKETGGSTIRLGVKRNGLFLWQQSAAQVELISNVMPYSNQWIDFRIDVKFAKDNTGYINFYVRLPGQSNYTLKQTYPNSITYNGTGTGGQHGYVKWGIYREAGKDANGNVITSDNPLTRIVYHDNIRIIKLPLQ
jgi:hypothetical protein